MHLYQLKQILSSKINVISNIICYELKLIFCIQIFLKICSLLEMLKTTNVWLKIIQMWHVMHSK